MTKMKMMLVVKMKLAAVTNPIRINIDSPTSLYAFRRQLDVKMALAEVRSIEAIKMTVETKRSSRSRSPRKRARASTPPTRRSSVTFQPSSTATPRSASSSRRPSGTRSATIFMATNNARAERSETFS